MNSQPGWRRGTLAAVVTTVLMLSVTVGPVLRPVQSVASAAGPQGPAGKAVNEAAVAKKLAAKVYGAHSAKARYTALLSVMKTLGIGVYTAKLKRIVRGAERGPKDFYLYDFEVTALAYALRRKEMRQTADLASTLSGMGVHPADKPLDPELLRQALFGAVQSAAAHPTDPFSLRPLLIRELGLRHDKPYDMLHDVPMEQLQFDWLQSFLILTDALMPVIAKIKPPADRDMNGVSRDALRPASVPSSICDTIAAAFAAAAYWGAKDYIVKYIAKVLQTSEDEIRDAIERAAGKLSSLTARYGKYIPLAYLIMDILHLLLIEAYVDVRSTTPDNQRTHLGPPGHPAAAGVPGQELRFTVKAVMNKDFGDRAISCGELVGFKLPRAGPIRDVPVVWYYQTHSVFNYKGGLGTISPGAGKTGPDGAATTVFKPLDEVVPGFGKEIAVEESMSALALYQWPFSGVLSLGQLTQLLVPKRGTSDFFVERHAPRGFKFEGLHFHYSLYTPDATGQARLCTPGPLGVVGDKCSSDDETYSGRICGEDPHDGHPPGSHVWTFTIRVDSTEYTEVVSDPAVYPRRVVDYRSVTYAPAYQTFPQSLPPGSFTFGSRFEFVPGPPPQMRYHEDLSSRFKGSVVLPSEISESVGITEDTSCPEPKP